MRCTSRFLVHSSLLFGIASIPAAAAELSFSELRLGAGALSHTYRGSSSTTITDQSNNVTTLGSSSNGRDADENWRIQLQYVGGYLGRAGGIVYGGGVAVNQATWDNGSQRAHATTPTADVRVGYGYAFTSQWHIELAAFGGYGRTYYSVSDSSSTETNNESETYVEFGGVLGTYVSLADRWALGIEVPYLVGRFKPDYSYNDNSNNTVTVTDTRGNQGFGLMATLGVRF